MVAASDHDANMLYAVGMFVPDPFIYLRAHGRSYIIMSDLEIDRARRQAPHCSVLSLTKYQKRLRQQGVSRPSLAQVIRLVLEEKKARSVVVPNDFPLGLASELKSLKVGIRAKPGMFFPEREFKSTAEVSRISAALRIAEHGMKAGVHALRQAKIGRNRALFFQGTPLTSEKLRTIIDTAILTGGGLASHTIVAGGQQACDPHETGHGQLRAKEPIILDIFPRSQETGYFGDITRTVVKGGASEAVRKLYSTVERGQRAAFKQMRAGVPTAQVHRTVTELFEREGYKTGKRNGRMEGFFHGTGHGIGLEIHEAPRTGQTSTGRLKAGQVVTVEPGLYYPEIGGVRLEDVALVTKGAPRNLTRFEKVLEI